MQAPVWITGVGSAVPERVLTNEEIERGMPWLDTTARWIEEHVGVCERRIVAPREAATDLALRAARQALQRAGVRAGEIELLLHATNTAEESFPAGAARILAGLQRESGENIHAGGIDLQQGCASFLGGVRLAAGMIAAGEISTALVTGADVASRMVDWTDRSTCILLGDGACAAVLVGDPQRASRGAVRLRYRAGYTETDPGLADAIRRDANLPRWNDPYLFLGREVERERAKEHFYGHAGALAFGAGYSPFFRMEGRDVYRFVKRVVPRRGYLEVLQRAGRLASGGDALGERIASLRSLEQVECSAEREAIVARCAASFDLLIPHQPNLYLLLELAEQMGVPLERMYVNIARYGNTSAPSIGIALEEALRVPSRYTTLTRRDALGRATVEGREVETPMFAVGQSALLLSFGAGNSWNYALFDREA
ncbi:MAG: ketoacyl-ACP synthase III [Planctomycetes bacterium]|nr:ketoacyl-ACP synthase III [Planctomycetota bacterium]